MDPQLQLKGSYKTGSIHLSVLLSVSFLRIGSLVFSGTWHGVRGSYLVMCGRAGFFAKNPHRAKMVENGPKRWFSLFKKIMSLVLSGICVKWKFLWFINILQKLRACEKSGSQVIVKKGSQPMRFQHSLIVNISLIDYYLTLTFGM